MEFYQCIATVSGKCRFSVNVVVSFVVRVLYMDSCGLIQNKCMYSIMLYIMSGGCALNQNTFGQRHYVTMQRFRGTRCFFSTRVTKTQHKNILYWIQSVLMLVLLRI